MFNFYNIPQYYQYDNNLVKYIIFIFICLFKLLLLKKLSLGNFIIFSSMFGYTVKDQKTSVLKSPHYLSMQWLTIKNMTSSKWDFHQVILGRRKKW